jgi:hypothetical protein
MVKSTAHRIRRVSPHSQTKCVGITSLTMMRLLLLLRVVVGAVVSVVMRMLLTIW